MCNVSGLSYKEAGKILKSEQLIGIERAWCQSRVVPTDEEMQSLETIPFTKGFLQSMSGHGCVLVALWPISLLKLRQVASTLFYDGPRIDSSWWLNEAFAQAEIGRAEWAVIYEEGPAVIIDQTGKLGFLGESPAAVVLAYTAILLNVITNGQTPMFRRPRLTSSVTNSGKPVYFQLMAGKAALF